MLPLSTCSPKIKLLYYVGISIFEKLEQTIQSNRSANRVRKKRPPSYFVVVAWTSSFILYFCNALDVSSPKKGVDSVEVSIFYLAHRINALHAMRHFCRASRYTTLHYATLNPRTTSDALPNYHSHAEAVKTVTWVK